jgi:thiamine phosphate synthase YjbQ (UPF0047 family)
MVTNVSEQHTTVIFRIEMKMAATCPYNTYIAHHQTNGQDTEDHIRNTGPA